MVTSLFKFVKHNYPSIIAFQLGTRKYTSIAVLTAIDGLFVYLVPNISYSRLPQLWFLTATNGFFAWEVEK